MTKTELDRFEEILGARAAEPQRLIRHRDGIGIQRSPDDLDGFQRARAALRRIMKGSFGTCLRWDEDIHPQRLVAEPSPPSCIRCRQAVDHDRARVQAHNRGFLASAA
jgi:hypothetical protein